MSEQPEVIVLVRPSWSSNPPYFARITLAGETVCDCPHSHSRRDLAERCGARLLAATTVTQVQA